MSRIGAALALVAAVLGLVVAWPQTWWPRQVPALAVTVVADQGAALWVANEPPVTPTTLPSADGPAGCGSAARHEWARSAGAAPFVISSVTAFLTALRRDTTVVLTGATPVVRSLPGEFDTGILLCPDEEWFAIGGGETYQRALTLDVTAATPTVEIWDPESGTSVDRLSLYLTSGEAAELVLSAKAEAVDGGVGQGWEWAVNLHVLVNGEEEVLRIPDEGYFKVAVLSAEGELWTDAAQPQTCSLDDAQADVGDGWC
ncbi:hypothetical protein ACFVQ3_05725 [Oerskovia sp. NPDC057915]|uniref:hypothetical protein n=1 Tax=Oerskovia sp. NPDC057915 TaxID=3346280 RepID=UPI0036DDD4FD